jgi:glutaredoxin
MTSRSITTCDYCKKDFDQVQDGMFKIETQIKVLPSYTLRFSGAFHMCPECQAKRELTFTNKTPDELRPTVREMLEDLLVEMSVAFEE